MAKMLLSEARKSQQTKNVYAESHHRRKFAAARMKKGRFTITREELKKAVDEYLKNGGVIKHEKFLDDI